MRVAVRSVADMERVELEGGLSEGYQQVRHVSGFIRQQHIGDLHPTFEMLFDFG